ncbi:MULTISPECIES: hypothetical protein [Vibrio]|jgi:hypothetical protein|uniref:hypothetical protein n=1 Tax=Vibrio TaxID=662 RepID=UPI002964F87B|nr:MULTISPECIES: hypothetical protein [unclassified Vibrio]MDW1835103.1 hypothetical protein [Vibrio sp. Vb0718]MDW2171247.1 hypothetical protein [Vibrio sp. 1567]
MKMRIEEMDKFETIERSIEENQRRIRALKSSGKLFDELRFRLQDCIDGGEPCGSLACKLCNRDLRIELVNPVICSVVESGVDKWHLLTVVPYEKSITAPDFMYFDVKAMKKWFGRVLRNFGFAGPIWGMMEIDYHSYADAWLPHFHIVLPDTKNNDVAYKALKKSRVFHCNNQFLEGTENRPYKRDPFDIVDSVTVLSYTHKLYGKEITIDRGGNKKGYFLREGKLSEYLLFMDSHDYSEFKFTLGISDHKWASLRKRCTTKRIEHYD